MITQNEKLANKIAQAVWCELDGRSMFNGIDKDIQDEISDALQEVILKMINNFDK